MEIAAVAPVWKDQLASKISSFEFVDKQKNSQWALLIYDIAIRKWHSWISILQCVICKWAFILNVFLIIWMDSGKNKKPIDFLAITTEWLSFSHSVIPLSVRSSVLNLIDFDMDASSHHCSRYILPVHQRIAEVNASWEKSVTNGDLIILQKMLRDENC